MVFCQFGGVGGFELSLDDHQDLVVVRTRRDGAAPDGRPSSGRSRQAVDQLQPLFGFPGVDVRVYLAPEGGSEELADAIDEDPGVRFAGRGLRDQYGAPVIYTENVFVKFAGDVSASQARKAIDRLGLSVKRRLDYAANAFFLGAPSRTGQDVFSMAEELLERDEVELCHPEVVRDVSRRAAFRQQWHLHPTVINGHSIEAHAHVVDAWEVTRGQGVVIAVIDDGFDTSHEEFSSPDKVVAPHTFTPPRSDDARPGEKDNHGTGCAGVACADGRFGASGVAPEARLMPLRLVSALGSQDEADAFVWAADHGAHVISCSWGPPDGKWRDQDDPAHAQVTPLPDSTRLAIDYAIDRGREGLGCVIAWAAGNGNESVDNDGYASNEKVIAVAASNDMSTKSAYSDHGDAIWCSFPSNHGDRSLTPGIWTTDRSGPDGRNPGQFAHGDVNGDYTNSFRGTSSACPGVAGVAALVLSRNPGLRWDEVKDLLRRSCDRIDDSEGEYDERGHSKRYGYGRVNAAKAVELAARAASGPPGGVSSSTG